VRFKLTESNGEDNVTVANFDNWTFTMRSANLQAALGLLACLAVSRCQAQNANGYVNVNCSQGFSLIACPLYIYPNNDPINSIDNTQGDWNGCQIFFWQNGTWANYTANNNPTPPATATNGWVEPNGPMLLPPGGGAAFYNPNSTNLVITFVGTIPGGVLTNVLNPGLNLVSSILPVGGDLGSSSLIAFPSPVGGQFDGDQLYLLFTSGSGSSGYTTYTVDSLNYDPPGNYGWDGLPGQPDPVLNVCQAFWYRAGNGSVQWTESYHPTEIVPRDKVKYKTSGAGAPVALQFDSALSPGVLKSGHFQLKLMGESGKLHVVEVSSDLKNWQPVDTNLWSSGNFVYTDPVPATNKARFYRGFALP
jgi:hypothetical protein